MVGKRLIKSWNIHRRVWILCFYLIFLVAICASLFVIRSQTLNTDLSITATEQWKTWRQKTVELADDEGPVKRRIPASSEPPQLLLMRDYFAICLAGAILFGSLLFLIIFVALLGVLTKSPAPRSDTTADRKP